MKHLITATTLMAMTLAFGSTIHADTPKLNERQSNQKARIAQGVKSGELTRKETVRMVNGQRQLQKMENRAKQDGVVTKKERARLQAKASKESAKIYRNKHDKNQRPKARQ